MKTSKQAQIKEIQAGCVVTPVGKAADIQQLGRVNPQPKKSGMIEHLGTISTLLRKDAMETITSLLNEDGAQKIDPIK